MVKVLVGLPWDWQSEPPPVCRTELLLLHMTACTSGRAGQQDMGRAAFCCSWAPLLMAFLDSDYITTSFLLLKRSWRHKQLHLSCNSWPNQWHKAVGTAASCCHSAAIHSSQLPSKQAEIEETIHGPFVSWITSQSARRQMSPCRPYCLCCVTI